MNILCINTCLKESDVSVIKDDGIYSAKRYTNLQHSITLMSQIEEALEKAEITKNELDLVFKVSELYKKKGLIQYYRVK